MDKDNTAPSPPKKESNHNSPRFMKGFKMIMFIGKQAKKNAGTDISGRKARSVITAKKQQRKVETKELKAAVTTLLKKGSAPKNKKGGKRAREEGGEDGSGAAAGEEELHILDNDNDDDDGGYADDADDDNNRGEDDRYLDANYEHVPNGLDIMFATTQRNPALMHPPKDRFECRDKLVSGGMYKEARELESVFNTLCEKEEGIIRKRAEDAAAAASGGGGGGGGGVVSSPSRLAQMTSPSTQRQRAAAAGKRKDMEVRTMLSLLGAKLGKSNNNNTSGGTTTPTTTADNDATAAAPSADEVELRNIETKKMDLQAKYTKLATTDVASATHHHKQLDAYLTCLLEFNHNLFGTLPLKDTLYNCSRLSKTDAGMRVLTFEEHTKALRKRRIEKEMERTFWNPQQQQNSSTSTNQRIASTLPNGVSTTDFDVEQIQLRAAAFMGSKPIATTTTAVSNEIPEDGSWEELAHQNNNNNGYGDDYEAEYEDLRGDMDDHHQHRADHEMDPYEYLMLYGVPPPSMMGGTTAPATTTTATTNNTTDDETAAENYEKATTGNMDEDDTPVAPLVEQTNTDITPTPHQEVHVEEPSTFTATLNIGNDEDTSSAQ